MSHQTKLFGIRALASQIESERIKIIGILPEQGKAAFGALEQKIDGWKRTIETIQRDLKSQSNFNHMIHQKERFGDHAFAAGQRLKSGEANVKELSDALADVAVKLQDLIDALWGGKPGEARALDAMKHALGNWLKTTKHSEQGVMGKAPTNLQTTVAEVRAQVPTPPAGPPAPGVVDIFTLILAYFVFVKSLTKKK